MQNQKIIAVTTTGAAKYKEILNKLDCDVMIVEEAAEILESHILTALNNNLQHIILIGDH